MLLGYNLKLEYQQSQTCSIKLIPGYFYFWQRKADYAGQSVLLCLFFVLHFLNILI